MESKWSRLQAIGKQPPKPESRAEVMDALASEVGYLREAAAKILSTWADDESTKALRTFLVRGFEDRSFAWVDRGNAIKALRECVGDTDATWLLDLYFSPLAQGNHKDLIPLLGRVSNAAQGARLRREIGSEDPETRRRALLAISVVHLPEERELAKGLSRDEDPEVQTLALKMLERIRRRGARDGDDPLLQAIVSTLRPIAPLRYLMELSHEGGDLLQCWRWSDTTFEEVPPESWRFVDHGSEIEVSREWEKAEFWLSDNGKELFVNWIAGPLFGRGWSFKLSREGGKVRLGDQTLRWIS